MRSRLSLARLLPLIAVPVCVAGLAVPAIAAPAGPGQVTTAAARSAKISPAVSKPTVAGFLEEANGIAINGYNSLNQGVGMQSGTTGQYTAEFGGMGGQAGTGGVPIGNIQVSPTGESAVTCTIANVLAVFNILNIQVDCFSYAGAPSSGFFNLTFTHPVARPSGELAYAWVSKAAASYTPTGTDQYNSTGKANKVRHLGTGEYLVTMPGPAKLASKGTVHVTPLGATAGDCNLAGWTAGKAAQLFSVRCYSAAGKLQNREFTIAYASGNNLMGENGKTDANAFASRSSNLYQPKVQYNSRKGAQVGIVRLSTGLNEVFFAGSAATANKNGGAGDVQITSVAGSDRHCLASVQAEPDSPFAVVLCLTNAGKLVNTPFMIQWVVNP